MKVEQKPNQFVKIAFYVLTLFSLISFNSLHAQEAVTSSGTSVSNSNGAMSYSIGQAVYTAVTGSGGASSQGVQQSYELIITDLFTAEHQVKFEAYPNPTSDYIILESATYHQQLFYSIFDQQGRLVAYGILKENSTVIPMQSLGVSTYLLKINDQHEMIKTFRIIKK